MCDSDDESSSFGEAGRVGLPPSHFATPTSDCAVLGELVWAPTKASRIFRALRAPRLVKSADLLVLLPTTWPMQELTRACGSWYDFD